MKNIKFFSRIVFAFVLVFVFSFNTLAVSISDFAPVEDYLTYNEYNEIYGYGYSASLLSLPVRNYDYDPNNLPWDEMPEYAQKIIYSGWQDPLALTTDARIPRTWGTVIEPVRASRYAVISTAETSIRIKTPFYKMFCFFIPPQAELHEE